MCRLKWCVERHFPLISSFPPLNSFFLQFRGVEILRSLKFYIVSSAMC
uniref:Uncharacterized protein n=1 Tax=Rhizophora mucronata TaxID=61149 RepID=A0A2P2MHQ7_RHIMU